MYVQRGKRNWIWCEMTDAEFLQFEMEYPAYKNAMNKELDIFYLGFIGCKDNHSSDDGKISRAIF